MNERIKKLRRSLDLTQQEFAARIGSVQNTITGYETGRRAPSSQVISLISKEFGVNENWLRNGEGEMFLPSPTSELDALAARYPQMTHETYVFIEKLVGLPESSQRTIMNFLREVVEATWSLVLRLSLAALRPLRSFMPNSTASWASKKKRGAHPKSLSLAASPS